MNKDAEAIAQRQSYNVTSRTIQVSNIAVHNNSNNNNNNNNNNNSIYLRANLTAQRPIT
jgi:hypothetical protein